MKVKVANSSSRKTREKIKKAFALLTKEKHSLNKITVTDLVKKADITRGAFYTHYENIYEVAKELQEDTLEVLVKDINQLRTLEYVPLYFDTIFAYLKEHEEIYTMIFSSNDPLLFTNTMSKFMSQHLCEILSNHRNISQLPLKVTLFVDGGFSLVVKHFKGEIPYSLDEIKEMMKDMFTVLFLQDLSTN